MRQNLENNWRRKNMGKINQNLKRKQEVPDTTGKTKKQRTEHAASGSLGGEIKLSEDGLSEVDGDELAADSGWNLNGEPNRKSKKDQKAKKSGGEPRKGKGNSK